jgi:GNAT superfamily N-acetyltransferase
MVAIRTACTTDIPALVNLCEQLGYPTTALEILGRVKDLNSLDDHLLLVAETDSGQVVGWVHGSIRKLLVIAPHIELGELVVDESQRGQGIGEQLLHAVEAWASDQGIKTVLVRSNAIRVDAHRFYQRLGYENVKTSLTFIKKCD